jgi:hypothetical protein
VGNAPLEAWVALDVTGAVVAGLADYGRVSLALTNDSNDAVGYSSKEGSHPPQLVVEYDPAVGPTPTNTPTPTPSKTPTPTKTPTHTTTTTPSPTPTGTWQPTPTATAIITGPTSTPTITPTAGPPGVRLYLPVVLEMP